MSEDNEYLEDGLGNSRRTKERLKKRVRDEYSSESSDLEDNAEEMPLESNKQHADADSDMFASEDESEEPKKEPKKKGPKKLLMSEFEKEAEIELTGNANDSEEKSDVEIEAFNLRKEEEEGYFDEDGNFVREEQSEDEDEWTNIDKSEIRKAKAAQEKMLAQKKASSTTESIEQLLLSLINVLEPAETVLEALSRMAPPKKKNKRKQKQVDTPENTETKALITLITDACDKLMLLKGVSDIYELTREELMRLYKTKTGEDFISQRGTKRSIKEVDESENAEENREEDLEDGAYGEKIWEFKWEDLEEINGPYSEYEMGYWKENYFENKVVARKIGQTLFTHISELMFEQ